MARRSIERCVWWWRERGLAYGDQFVLRWETDVLLELGASLTDLMYDAGESTAKYVAQYTKVRSRGVRAIAWPLTMFKAIDLIDPVWTIACERADEAGRLLAHALLERRHGARPVTLVGFALGARVIFSCARARPARCAGAQAPR